MSGADNLQDISKREDFKEITSKGGKATGKRLSTKLKAALGMTLEQLGLSTDDMTDEQKKMTLDDALVAKLAKKAIKDENDRSITEIFDRCEGKPINTQRIETDEIDEIKITIRKGREKPDGWDGLVKENQEDGSDGSV